MLKSFVGYLIFPGCLFSLTAGLLAGWIDRLVSARVQWRQGPPWYQNFIDIIKLTGKETIVPAGSKGAFLFAPYLGFLSAALVAGALGMSMRHPETSFIGDLIVFFYLLTIPAVAMIIGASSSANPLASVGASREMKMILSYELPFILSAVAIIIRSQGALRLGEILTHQADFGANIASLSGALAFIAALFCVQAKLGFAPFDVSEADQEIMGGTLIEYSGLPLAIFKMTKATMLYILPLFLIVLFWGENLNPFILVLKYLAILVAIILIKNTNPRLRVDQALRFFWGPVTLLAVTAVMLALLGK
ncbi:MAG: NADH-quinone oxidoreductase subunit H [Candidatus Omnitrophica bacterium]|nr:NADH-quinone oxidoreductase subunit H [Candidatus Omnitrophota bacterium]